MTTALRNNLNLEEEVSRLEAELKLYKELKLTKIERRLNELLDYLDNPAVPQTKGQRLRERIGIIAATVALTAIAQSKFEVPLVFHQPAKQEQVSPKFSRSLEPGLAKPQVAQAPSLAKPPVAQGISLDRLMNAIATQESGHNSSLVNSDSGASGKWQVMPENIPEWSRAALGHEVSYAEFISSAEVQQQIVRHRLNLYLNQQSTPGRSEEEVIRRIASAWYSGQPKLWNDTKPQYSNGKQYPSIAQYTASVWGLYQNGRSPKFSETKAIISTWAEQFQKDPAAGDIIAGYEVTSPRGMRTLNGVTRMHQGVDLGTPLGTKLYAIADGIIECDLWADAGKVGLFTSDKFPGLRFDLLHLDSCIAQRWQKIQVRAGQQIGTTGAFGTGPHLHLAIKSLETNNFLRVRGGWLYWFLSGEKPKGEHANDPA